MTHSIQISRDSPVYKTCLIGFGWMRPSCISRYEIPRQSLVVGADTEVPRGVRFSVCTVSAVTISTARINGVGVDGVAGVRGDHSAEALRRLRADHDIKYGLKSTALKVHTSRHQIAPHSNIINRQRFLK